MVFEFFNRTEWGAKHGLGIAMDGPKPLVVIHHSYLPNVICGATISEMKRQVRSIERFHVVDNGWSGIDYNWLIFQSGHIFEGRGWGRVGAHTEKQNSKSYGICLVINGDTTEPSMISLESVARIIKEGMFKGHISKDFQLKGHSDFSTKSCPGSKIIKHYSTILRLLQES